MTRKGGDPDELATGPTFGFDFWNYRIFTGFRRSPSGHSILHDEFAGGPAISASAPWGVLGGAALDEPKDPVPDAAGTYGGKALPKE